MRGSSIARYAAARRPSPLRPGAEYVALFLLVLSILGVGLWLVGDRHAARREAQIMCVREIQIEIRRRPILGNVVPAAEPCITLARIRGESR